MKTNIAVFAQQAELDASGALARLERPYNYINARQFPTQSDGLTLVLGFTCEPADYAAPQRIALRIVDPDGTELATLSADPITLATKDPGYPMTLYQLVPLSVKFPREGAYVFEVRVNDARLAEVPLYVGREPKR
jgi:hypothetical protein